jgi:hypothetical protein
MLRSEALFLPWLCIGCYGRLRTTPLSTAAGASSLYMAALRRELHLSPAGGNHSVEIPGILKASQSIAQEHLILVAPPRYVQTVQKALGSVHYINRCATRLPRTLPRHFVLAAWVLQERFMGKSNGLWRLWLESLPALDPPIFWSDAELLALEDQRAMQAIAQRRRDLEDEYERMMLVLLDECGMHDDMEGDTKVRVHDYLWAVSVVTTFAWHFAPDFPVLVPLTVRFHPRAKADVSEWGTESDPGAALYAGGESIGAGTEITAWSEVYGSNFELLLYTGYVWNELSAARPQLQLYVGKDTQHPRGTPSAALEARRSAMLEAAKWSASMAFEMDAAQLDPEMLAWLRLVLASPDEIEAASSHEAFRSRGAVSQETEQLGLNALLLTIEKALASFEYSVEEDEEILAAHARADSRARVPLPPRMLVAATYRRAAKRALLKTQEMARLAMSVSGRALQAVTVNSASAQTYEHGPSSAAALHPTEQDAQVVGKRKRRKNKRTKTKRQRQSAAATGDRTSSDSLTGY